MIILTIFVLLVFLYLNNSEHFGATDTINPEAVRNISSVYNTDNLTATNIIASKTLTSPYITSTDNINANIISLGDARIKKGEKSPDTIDFMLGDGTGRGINFKKYNNTTVARINDQGTLNLYGDANIKGDTNITGKLNVTGDITGTIKPNKGQSKNNATSVLVEEGIWGVWGKNGDQKAIFCPDNTYVCGLKTRFEGSLGGDDTALNGIEMQCCKF